MSSQNKILLLLDNPDELGSISRIIENPSPETAVVSLAEAIVASPPWNCLDDAVLVVRPTPTPLIAVMGKIDTEDEQRLLQLRWQIERLLPTLSYVDYQEAQRQVELLAQKIKETYNRKEIESFCFTALPRGGHIVLGMLAYALQIDRSQLMPPYPSDRTLVVVDDCAISGVNFGRFLESVDNKRIIFVHLYSHPDLRTAVLAQEEKVISCLSSADLADIAPALFGSDYPSWKSRWQSRMDSAGYWVGQPEYVAFAWNEPDISFWNPAAKKLERGWNLLSPSLCLKNRSASAATQDQIYIQPKGCGPMRPAENVIFASYHGGIIVGNTQTEECYFLQDMEADIWSQIVALGTVQGVVSALSPEYAVDGETLRKDISTFVEQLEKSGLLEKNDEAEITPRTT